MRTRRHNVGLIVCMGSLMSELAVWRVQILESEGTKQAKINQAEGEKETIILKSEAARTDAINRATGAMPCHRALAKCLTAQEGTSAVSLGMTSRLGCFAST